MAEGGMGCVMEGGSIDSEWLLRAAAHMCSAVLCAVRLSVCCVANAAAVVASAGDWGGDGGAVTATGSEHGRGQ